MLELTTLDCWIVVGLCLFPARVHLLTLIEAKLQTLSDVAFKLFNSPEQTGIAKIVYHTTKPSGSRVNLNTISHIIHNAKIWFSCPNFLESLQRHMFYLLNSLNIVRLLTEQTRAAQLPLSSQSESMYYAKKMDFWLINLIVIFNNQSCWQKANIEGFLVTQRGISLGGWRKWKKHVKNLLFRKAKNREEIQMTIVKPEKNHVGRQFHLLYWYYSYTHSFF